MCITYNTLFVTTNRNKTTATATNDYNNNLRFKNNRRIRRIRRIRVRLRRIRVLKIAVKTKVSVFL